MTTVYVPWDSAARSVGADAVAAAIQAQATYRRATVEVVRNGSRAMMWLEPLVEVVTPQGRVGYGPVTPDDVASLFDAGFLDGGAHELAHGLIEQIPWLARQDRLTFSRVGIIDPLSTQDYQAHGGLVALRRALAMSPKQICDEVTESGLRGRGGAGFPTGLKWRTVLDTSDFPKFVTCNADEGDSGTFADRMLMEGDPFMVIEGMIIAGIAVGAGEGFIYIRSEYPDAVASMRAAIATAYQIGWLGPRVLGSDHAFDLHGILRVSVGQAWAGMSEPERADLLMVFRQFTVASYVANFDDFGGEHFEVLPDLRSVGTDEVVATRLIPASGTPTRLDYVMRRMESGWRAVDVLLEGTISRVAVQRSDFRSLLAHGSASPLIASLRKKTQDLSGGSLS